MTNTTIDQLNSQENNLKKAKQQNEDARKIIQLVLSENDESLRTEKRLLSEISALFCRSNERHFFQDQEQQYSAESTRFLTRLNEDEQSLKRDNARLTEQIDDIDSERKNLMKQKERDV